MRLRRLGRLGVVLGVVAFSAAACARDPAGPRDAAASRSIQVFELPAIDAIACRYGGSYPACEPSPASPFGPDQMDPGTEPIDPVSGGYYPPPDSTRDCDPSLDPKCEKALSSTDSATIRNAIGRFMRPDSAIADTTNRRLCNQMLNRFLMLFQKRLVFRGAYDSQGADAHYGATSLGHIHFDPWLLGQAAKGYESAQRELVNTALHESGHVLGYTHPNEFDANGHYTDPPFNLLDPGPNVCNR